MKSTINLQKILSLLLFFGIVVMSEAQQTRDTVYVEMAAIDQPFMYNRLGAAQPTGMVFALTKDLDTTLPANGVIPDSYLGTVRLDSTKRPRPIVLRANEGDILKIKFTNLLSKYDPTAIINAYDTIKPGTVDQLTASQKSSNQGPTGSTFQKTRSAGVHIMGTEMVSSILSDGSNAGFNDSSLVQPGGTITYTLIVPKEGVYMLYSTAAQIAAGGQKGGQLSNGLFGSLNVEPRGAEWYRSQVSEEDMDLAIAYYMKKNSDGSIAKVAKKDVDNIYESNDVYPFVDYDKTYDNGDPILKMYKKIGPNTRQLMYTDLTAIITGPNRGDFTGDGPTFFPVPASPDRRQSFREISIHYHESPYTVQAFPISYEATRDSITPLGEVISVSNTSVRNTIATGNDAFSINYGSGGIGAEIYANRIGVGPMADCEDCAYEEFFLSSWSVGDPAMVVDVPANANKNAGVNQTLQNQFYLQQNGSSPDSSIVPTDNPKATRTLYAADPSNVYHSYMNDHVKFRLTHAGKGLTHVHHQHAHQWLHTPDSDNGHYLDSQTINPGSSYTLEMVYDGSGNLNKTVGDQIFHCHFYPHFAAGMWALWRVHDVLELGTELDENGIAKPNSRALPDGEIKNGTAIPGVVPIPQLAMAPVPSKVHIEDGNIVVDDVSRNPGYPFFIPGLAGSRAPNPPMDYAIGNTYNADGSIKAYDQILNGGLPRSVISKANVAFENHSQFDWTKIIKDIEIIELPNDGTIVERVAMKAHATRNHYTLTPTGKNGIFNLNGRPPVQGAPYADPAVDLDGNGVGTKRTYKGANIQLDVVFNKKGWHYPQQRIISLWGDVNANMEGIKPPEPFFMRAESTEYIEYWHTNLVPEYYELDDFQVRTPTDIIGQHIHLVKFDVTSSDGAANGFNYEDGTLAPDMVRERIDAINNGGKRYISAYVPGSNTFTVADTTNFNTTKDLLVAQEPNPIWGKTAGQDWRGAQTTIQRWYADPLLNNRGEDRTLRTVFTHDHFGPSTHQQIGLYGGLLIEPENTKWIDPVTGQQLSTATDDNQRGVIVGGTSMLVSDGGPTSWQANIVYEDKPEESYREFMLEFQDTQQAYLAGSKDTIDPYPVFPEDWTNKDTLNSFVEKVQKYRGWLDPANAIHNNGYPELISFGFRGTYSMNYRNEPLPLRASEMVKQTGDSVYYSNRNGEKGYDLSNVYSSTVPKPDPAFNTQPIGGSRIAPDSKFKYPEQPISPGMQPMDPYTPLMRAYANDKIQIRTLVGAHVTSHWFNVHGVKWLFEPSFKNSGFRSTQNMSLSEHFEMNFKIPVNGSKNTTDYLYQASADAAGLEGGLWGLMRAYTSERVDVIPLPNNEIGKNPISNMEKDCGCPDGANPRNFYVAAYSINALTGGSLSYNNQFNITQSDALVFVGKESDTPLTAEDLKSAWKGEPMVLRANAGDCITVNLMNAIPSDYITTAATDPITNYQSAIPSGIIADTLTVSTRVGLHAELLSYDVSQSDGSHVGLNSDQTVGIGEPAKKYVWYAGQWVDGKAQPVEFGSILLSSSDRVEQYRKGLFGALIIEPMGATWKVDENSDNSANVYIEDKNEEFREFVFQFQDNIAPGYAINYKTEPIANIVSGNLNQNDLTDMLSMKSDTIYNHQYPETPHFVATLGTPMRLRMLHTGGLGGGETFTLHGHSWQEEPYTKGSTELGYNPMSQQFGFRDQFGPLNYFDLLIDSAGGENGVPGDYLYYDVVNLGFQGGVWGILTVSDGVSVPVIGSASLSGKTISFAGRVGGNPKTGRVPDELKIIVEKKITRKKNKKRRKRSSTKVTKKVIATITVDPNGTWSVDNLDISKLRNGFVLSADDGGTREVTRERLGQLINNAKLNKGTSVKKPSGKKSNVPQPGDTKHGTSDKK